MKLILSQHQRVHFVGVGGIGMSALARVLLARGYVVSGSDRNAGDQTDMLGVEGVAVQIGHRAENIRGADLVVISSAVPSDNAEVQEALHQGIQVVKRAELLAAIANTGFGLAVAGTHGKTTTSCLIGHILVEAGMDPTLLLGGISQNLGSNARSGESDLVVVEADEYDATFLRLQPKIGVITNVAAEHLDFFRTIEGVYTAFRQFATGVSETLVICADDPILASLVDGCEAKIISYGNAAVDWRADQVVENGAETQFQVRHDGSEVLYSTRMAGAYNVLNALAAIAVAAELEVPQNVTVRALASFAGVQRRSEIKGEAAGVLVMDDYAVHPTEIRVTLDAIKRRFARPLRVIFQPHTYSRMQTFMAEFATSFGAASAVYVMDVYASRESDTLGISGRDMADALRREHPCVKYVETAHAALAAVVHEARNGDVIVTMGAGDVTHLGPAILTALEQS